MDKSLFKNTLYLYLITFSNYFFGFVTLPYQTRVLGPEIYGVLGFAAAFQVYFNLLFDFGFLLSGTKRVSESTNNVKRLSEIFSGVFFSKILLIIVSLLIFSIICIYVPYLRVNIIILLLYFVLAALNSLIPDYLYRGLEQMGAITIRTLITRICFTLLIFVFLRAPEQYYLVPIFQIVGTLVALSWVWYDLRKNYNITIMSVSRHYLIGLYKESFPYFVSRIASSIYNVTNTIILGFVYPVGNIVGYYTSVDKVRGLVAQGCSPVADSFYPYMLRTRNYKSLFKIVIILEIFIILGCFALWLFAEQICVLIFGSEFRDAAVLLRYMIPIIAIILPTYMFGFPALTPLNLSKWANYSVEIAMLNQIVGLLILYLFHCLNVYSICVLTVVSESLCFIVRLFIFIYYYNRKSYEEVE